MQQDIRHYAGRRPQVDDPLMRGAYITDISISEMVYPRGTADWDQKDRQVVLNEHTADYLYSSFTPLTLHYQPGSRPVLERIALRLCRPEMTEREKVFAILNWSYDGFKEEFTSIVPKDTKILNATEEEMLKLGGGQCEDRSRLIICLCQIAGFPARLVAAYTWMDPKQNYQIYGGHAIEEIYLEGGWCFFDSLHRGFYCIKPDGRIASAWDIIRHPELAEQQTDAVLADCRKTREEFLWYRHRYLSGRNVVTLSHYAVWDCWKYDWKWIQWDKASPKFAAAVALREELRKKLLAELGVKPQ